MLDDVVVASLLEGRSRIFPLLVESIVGDPTLVGVCHLFVVDVLSMLLQSFSLFEKSDKEILYKLVCFYESDIEPSSL